MHIEEILKSFSGRSAVVTGGTGLIGRAIVKTLCDAGASVKVVSLDKVAADPRATHVIGDLCDFSFCRAITKDMDLVLHVAGIKGSVEVTKSKPASILVPLLMMNTNMLEAARLSGAQRVVYTSTIGAYASAEVFSEEAYSILSEPMDQFPGWAKRMAELQVQSYSQQYGLENFAVVRPCNVYGPGDNFDPANAMVIPSLMARVAAGENPVGVWGDGSAERDFLYSEDAAEGVLRALYFGTRGSFVNLGSGRNCSVRELVETLASVVPFKYEFDPTKPAGFPRRVMDMSRARDWIGFVPRTSLRDGLEKTWKWFVANSQEYTKRQNYWVDAPTSASK